MATYAMSATPGPLVLLVNAPFLSLPMQEYRIESAKSADDTLERLRQKPLPELVLMNLEVPGGDGLRTLQRARELHPDLKVIMFGPGSDARSAALAVRMGALDYLSQPLEESELQAAVHQYLQEPVPSGAGSRGRTTQ